MIKPLQQKISLQKFPLRIRCSDDNRMNFIAGRKQSFEKFITVQHFLLLKLRIFSRKGRKEH